MDTAERQHIRDLAQTMEATFKGDEKGLAEAQMNAHHAIEQLRVEFPHESNETLCCIARALTIVVGRLSNVPAGFLSENLSAMIAAYPLASGALLGVYTLPAHECEIERAGAAERTQVGAASDDGLGGGYL